MHYSLRFLLVATVSSLVGACATTHPVPNRFCESTDILVDASFEGGNFFQCVFKNRSTVSITIKPEDEPPINQSPWYSFRLSPKRPTEANIEIAFVDGYARYWPKFSSDRHFWRPVPVDTVRVSEDDQSMTIEVNLMQTPLWISAQELILPDFYEHWMRELAADPNVTTQTLGRSVQGKPIHVAKTADKSDVLFLIGRQHPPEVTGAFAMRSFVSTVMGDTDLAREFREHFSIVIIPLINPDGVSAGHWRHNMNGVDLNRDWGPFSQPETQGVADLLRTMEVAARRPVLMLDFHSTRDSLFYTQMPGEIDPDFDFATEWLTRSRNRLPDFEFKHAPRPPSGQPNTKNYFFSRYHIPAITYEIGDEVDRQTIAASTPVFAEEMMRLLLERR